jgi:DNA-binding response OmpR family regulator
MKWIKHRPGEAAGLARCEGPLVVGPVALHSAARRVLVEGYVVHLPAHETAVLGVLMRNPGRVLSRDELLGELGERVGHGRQLPRLMRRLSRRLAVHPLLPRLIERVGSDGYRFTSIRSS